MAAKIRERSDLYDRRTMIGATTIGATTIGATTIGADDDLRDDAR